MKQSLFIILTIYLILSISITVHASQRRTYSDNDDRDQLDDSQRDRLIVIDAALDAAESTHSHRENSRTRHSRHDDQQSYDFWEDMGLFESDGAMKDTRPAKTKFKEK